MNNQTIASFIHEPNMKAGAAVVLLLLSKTEPDGVARYDSERFCYDIDTVSSAYYNGRENGFVLQVSRNYQSGKVLNIYCSQDRSCDSLFVETWETDFYGINPPANNRPESAYQNRTMFGETGYVKAVDFIKSKIKSHLDAEYAEADARNQKTIASK
jgi:hypothetical protein